MRAVTVLNGYGDLARDGDTVTWQCRDQGYNVAGAVGLATVPGSAADIQLPANAAA